VAFPSLPAVFAAVVQFVMKRYVINAITYVLYLMASVASIGRVQSVDVA
jgi:hypothetical protein